MPLLHRRQHPQRRKHPPQYVVHARPRPHRLARHPRHVRQSAHHLHDLVQRHPMLIRPRQEPLATAIDQPRVLRPQRLIGQPQLVQRPRPEVLDQHVGLRQQPPRDPQPLPALQVERQAALVAVQHGEEPGPRALQPPRVVAAGLPRLVRWLDLDDVGAQIRQRQAAGRAHHHVHELDDAQPPQRRLAHAAIRNVFGTPARARPPCRCSSGNASARIARASSSFGMSIPVRIPMLSSMNTRSSVTMFPLAPGA